MLVYRTIPVTPYEQNCSLLWDAQQAGPQEAACIDPGGDLGRIEAAAREWGLRITQIWLTHGHLDHAGGAGELATRLGIPVMGPHIDEKPLLDALPQQCRAMGFPPAIEFTPSWLAHGDALTLAGQRLHVLHCPGHTRGHVVFHAPQIRRAFVGDVLFAGSIGRTDLPGGNYEQLIKSIKQRLWPLGDETVFIPGHGPESSFGQERVTNPFVGGE